MTGMRCRILAAMLALAAAGGSAVAGEYGAQYAADRAEIEDLQGRYLFALDWQDPEAYASTFTEEGVLVWAGGTVTGRAAIREEVTQMRKADEQEAAKDAPLRPFRRRHFITNVVLKVDGDRATGRAYWFETNNDNADRSAEYGNYGYYEDDLQRVDGRWLFSRRQIFNEGRENMVAGKDNPAW